MKNRISILVLCLVTMLALTGIAFAADSAHYDVKAKIASTSGITVNIAKVVGSVYTFGQAAVDFGQLALTGGNFVPADGGFYAVDVGVNSNATWTITHTRTDFALIGSPATNLNNNVNVTFVNQPGTTGTPTTLTNGFVSYGNSNNFAITKAMISTGFYPRIYYGIASGTGDAAGVVAIPSTQAAGNYLGTVTLSLTP